MVPFVLASASPRRQAILEQMGYSCEVVPSECEETIDDKLSPQQNAVVLAKKKAIWVSSRQTKDCIVIGADTMVIKDGEVFGKPENKNHAGAMLRALSGGCHTVITGICVARGSRVLTDWERTVVTFISLSDEQISDYLAFEEYSDKAAAYGIQGRACKFVERIEGCYYNVVGLPVVRLMRLIDQMNQDALCF